MLYIGEGKYYSTQLLRFCLLGGWKKYVKMFSKWVVFHGDFTVVESKKSLLTNNSYIGIIIGHYKDPYKPSSFSRHGSLFPLLRRTWCFVFCAENPWRKNRKIGEQ